MDSYRSIGIAAALGGGTGTVLAIAFGQHWALGSLVGLIVGALVGGLSFRPLEVAPTLWSVVRMRWRALAWSIGALAALTGIVTLWMRWPYHAIGTVTILLVVGALHLGWPHRTAITRAVLWFTGKALAVAWGIGTFLIGATALPLVLTCAIGGSDPLLPFLLGPLSSLFSLLLPVMAWGTGLFWSISKSDARPSWQWAFTRWLLPRIHLDDEPTPSDPNFKFIPPGWGNLQIDRQYIRWHEFRRLSHMTRESAFFIAIAPLLLAGLAITTVTDVVVTSALALASTGRLAAMEGAFIGSTAGFMASRLGTTPLLAVAIGAVVAAASGIGLYRLRHALDTRTEAAAA